jgi:hypothetical protein
LFKLRVNEGIVLGFDTVPTNSFKSLNVKFVTVPEAVPNPAMSVSTTLVTTPNSSTVTMGILAADHKYLILLLKVMYLSEELGWSTL